MESTWVRTTHAKVARTRAAFGLAELIRYYVSHTEATVARLTVYRLPELAPSVTLTTTTPARFLSDSLPFVLLAIGNHPSHILLLDGLGHRVFETVSGKTRHRGFVAPGYLGCSPITDHGLGIHPCRSDAWPFG